MRTSTSRETPPLRKSEPVSAIPDDYLSSRWSDDDLHRVLALSVLGVFVFGAAWVMWRTTWLLWPAGLCALVVQFAATMVAARAAVESRDATARAQSGAPRARREDLLSVLARLVPPAAPADGSATAGTQASASDPAQGASPVLTLPAPPAAPHDDMLHRAFFRRIVEAEFAEHLPGLAWPDLTALQGSLSTRLRLFQRQPATAPVPVRDVSEAERAAHSPWHHLAVLEASEYRRSDALARCSHRAFAPMAFLELHARIDLHDDERKLLEAELLRLYAVGFGRILTPPSVLSAAEPLRARLGGPEALALVDEARLAMRCTGNMLEAERVRDAWHARARSMRDQAGWPGEVLSLVLSLIDYWLVQRAAAADVEWAEELARLEDTSVGAALAKRDAVGTFQFAEALQTACGIARGASRSAAAQEPVPTTAATMA